MPNLKGYFDKGVLKEEVALDFIAAVSNIVQKSLPSASVNSYNDLEGAKGMVLLNGAVQEQLDEIGQQSGKAKFGRALGMGGSGERASKRQEAFKDAVGVAILNLIQRNKITLRDESFTADEIVTKIRTATAKVLNHSSQDLGDTVALPPQAPVRARPPRDPMPLPPEANVYMTPIPQEVQRAAEADPIYAVADDTRRLRWNFRNLQEQSSTDPNVDGDYDLPQDAIPPGQPGDNVYFVPQGADSSQDPTVGRDNLSSRPPQEAPPPRPGRPSSVVAVRDKPSQLVPTAQGMSR